MLYVGWQAYSVRSVDTIEAGISAFALVVGFGISIFVGYLSQRPAIANLTPPGGSVGDPVIVAGSNFGSVQGHSIVAFNGVLATAAKWSDTRIDVSVPPKATTGDVVVTVSGVVSNGLRFTVT